ncbi:hypothetical protein COL516b_001959 [Colletotrichum fioriniae]|nr:uncharacterized protein COL516b_001959 [Colletotrichum fioriniae]KAJ0311254.1 hypothetical protein COL516b_001959 [Colletotrichum fioriniae]
MAILNLLTLALAAAAMASPASFNDATPTDPKDALVRKDDWDKYLQYMASLGGEGAEASEQAAVHRLCDLSFEEAKQREITMSTYFTMSDRCNFYAYVVF